MCAELPTGATLAPRAPAAGAPAAGAHATAQTASRSALQIARDAVNGARARARAQPIDTDESEEEYEPPLNATEEDKRQGRLAWEAQRAADKRDQPLHENCFPGYCHRQADPVTRFAPRCDWAMRNVLRPVRLSLNPLRITSNTNSLTLRATSAMVFRIEAEHAQARIRDLIAFEFREPPEEYLRMEDERLREEARAELTQHETRCEGGFVLPTERELRDVCASISQGAAAAACAPAGALPHSPLLPTSRTRVGWRGMLVDARDPRCVTRARKGKPELAMFIETEWRRVADGAHYGTTWEPLTCLRLDVPEMVDKLIAAAAAGAGVAEDASWPRTFRLREPGPAPAARVAAAAIGHARKVSAAAAGKAQKNRLEDPPSGAQKAARQAYRNTN